MALQSGSGARNNGADLGTSYNEALDPEDTTWPPSLIIQGDHSSWEIGATAAQSTIGTLLLDGSTISTCTPR